MGSPSLNMNSILKYATVRREESACTVWNHAGAAFFSFNSASRSSTRLRKALSAKLSSFRFDREWRISHGFPVSSHSSGSSRFQISSAEWLQDQLKSSA